MFNTVIKENVQGRKHPWSHAFAEPALLTCSYRRPKQVIQQVKNGHKNLQNILKYHDENYDEIEFYQGNSKRSI